MQERPENFNDVGEEPETTLVTPRFDAEEARRAHPVVPLAEARPRARFANLRTYTRRGLRRSWPPALIIVALLAVVAVGGAVVSKVLRRPHASNAPAQTEVSDAPAQAAEAPQPAEASQQAEPAPPREEARVKQQPRANRAVREQSREERGDISVPNAILRGTDSDDRGEERHGHGKGDEKRRARGGDEAEKEMRKDSKRAKGKVPRLVDVLVNPPD